ncbi:MAG: hypothetical protein WC781_00070 [Candidatus Pacearchaeota archaeon]|jgi:hypothetical protein
MIKKRGQIKVLLIILFILIAIVLTLFFLFIWPYFFHPPDKPEDLQNITRIEQIDDSIQHNITLTSNPANCKDECSAKGLKKCSENGYRICGNFDKDNCYEWSFIISCNSGKQCISGICKEIITETPITPPIDQLVRYDFDEVEILSTEVFNITKSSPGQITWADGLLGESNNLEVTHAVFNLKKNGQVLRNSEEYLKVEGSNGDKRFLLNSGGGYIYLGEGLKSVEKQFWSAKQLIGDDIVKDKTPPIYSVNLLEILDEQNKLISAKLSFSDYGSEIDQKSQVFNWFIYTNQNNQNQTQNNTEPVSEYKCPGVIIEGLCNGNPNYVPFSRRDYFEDENIKIKGNPYISKISVGDEFNFSFYIENKKSVAYEFDLSHFIPATYFEIVNSEFSLENVLKHYILHLNPNEKKQFNMTLRAIKENLFGSGVFFELGILNETGMEFIDYTIKVESNSGYILCSGIKFPATFHDETARIYNFYNNDYKTAKCCNNIFYPSFECCSDNDCDSGKCVDGMCINRMFQGNSVVRDPAIGNKKLLVILSSNAKTDNSPCFNKKENYSKLTSEVERFYDNAAAKYLNESDNFINFDWTIIGNFNIHDLGLEGQLIPDEILNKSAQLCNINPYFYDEIVVYNPEHNLCSEAPACAGRPILTKVFSDEYSSTIAHELAHNFGCRDLYTIGGGQLQWATGLMSTKDGSGNDTSLATLDVCRGELGWSDLNGNGIIDVKEFKQPTQIKINYTGFHDEERSKGKFIIFENLDVFGLNNNIKVPFFNLQPNIIIKREGVEQYICSGKETCAPVIPSDIIIIRAEYSYIDIYAGKLIKFSDEIKFNVSDLL